MLCRGFVLQMPTRKASFSVGSWHSFQSEQRSEPSAGVGVPEGKDSPGVVAQFSLHVFHLSKSVWREHQGITSAVAAYGFATHAFGVHTTNAGSSEAAGV